MSPLEQGRTRESQEVQAAYQAASVGRLMMGELGSWQEFMEPDTTDWSALPRRELRARRTHVRTSLLPEIEKFCRKNFSGMTPDVLRRLFLDVRARRGFECPRQQFETKYARLSPDAAAGSPPYATVVISLWGLQFWVPEDNLAQDLAQALELGTEVLDRHHPFYAQNHAELRSNADDIKQLVRRRLFSARAGLLCAFNLTECFLNSLAWRFLHEGEPKELSAAGLKLLQDTAGTSLGKKLRKYPFLITGAEMTSDDFDDIERLLSVLKPFRDSLVHVSPFLTPEKFGGHDKLELVARLDVDTLIDVASLATRVIRSIANHVAERFAWAKELRWLDQLEQLINSLPAVDLPERQVGVRHER